MNLWELSISGVNYSSFFLPEKDGNNHFTQFVNEFDNKEQHKDKKWEPLVLLKQEQRIDPDFFDLYDSGSILVSSKGKSLLEIFLNKGSYEFFSFLNDEDDFFLFNLKKEINDCLIKEKSIFTTLPTRQITEFEYLFFDPKIVEREVIFRVPELPYSIFVSDEFEYEYNSLGLKGLNFDRSNLIFTA